MVVGRQLEALVRAGLVDYRAAYDGTSLTLRLHRHTLTIEPPPGQVVEYGTEIDESWCRQGEILETGTVIYPQTGILACSEERVRMPPGFMGLVQTKGSLARLFITATSCDGQVDPGYEGRITFEMSNIGNFPVSVKPLQPVAQLYVFKATADDVIYEGRYQHADSPTVSRPLPDDTARPNWSKKLLRSGLTA